MTVPEVSGAPQTENRVAVILVNYHSEQYLEPCLAAVARQSLQPHRLIVADNGSTADRLAEVL
ncbi:MAG TPA: glycosyltransferase, partial [Planctomycetaceae bacterium]